MKELSIEEKAKRYDIALEKIKMLLGTGSSCSREELEYVFPELKIEDSEDENIRKAMIKYFTNGKEYLSLTPYSREDYIAWIEKQAGQKPNPCENCGIATNNCQKFPCTIKDGERKPADKVEPKFKVGDWIISHYNNVAYIKSIDDKNYFLSCSDGNSVRLSIDCINRNWRLWTIQDAKDGDVLACENGWTCIFKALDNHINTFSSYCFMDSTKWFCETGSECHTLKEEFVKAYNGKIYPATKEQRDTLEKEMADAGYTFDFEKKELKKIEQKPAWSEEDEEIIRDIHCFLSYRINCHLQEQETQERAKKIVSWLDELKNRVLSQPKQEWSKEGEYYHNIIMYCLNGESVGNADKENAVLWLKSLRPQSQWKPSIAQLNALSIVSKGNAPDDIEAIMSLYNDLKKLREE